MYCVVLTAPTDRFSLFLSLSPPYYCKRAQICGGYNGERLPRIRGRKKKRFLRFFVEKETRPQGRSNKTRIAICLSLSARARSLAFFFVLSFLELSLLVFACVRLVRAQDVQWKLTPSTRAHAHITHLLSSSSSTKEWKKKKALRERGRGRRRRRRRSSLSSATSR